MSDFRAGILDLDGVVVDSEALHLEATKIVFSEFSLRLPGEGAQAYVGRTDLDIFTEAVRGARDQRLDVHSLLEEKNRVYGSITDRMQLVPGALAFIRALAASPLRLGLATSSIRVNQGRAFTRFGLDEYFDATVTADDVERTKPDPAPYLLAAQRLNVDPDKCFVVEDSYNGVKSAKAAGCYVVGLTTSFPAEQLERAGADFAAAAFEEIYDHLDIQKLP